MSSWLRLCLLLSLLAMAFGSPVRLTAAEEATRTFPAQKCRFTLPGPDWSWSDEKAPNRVFLARSTKGFAITLATVKTPDPVQVNEQFAKGFEESFYQDRQAKKRGGRFITFLGLPSYQTESLLVANGRTLATRVFAAHGFVYNLSLVGAKEPIEDDPAFETLMQAFSFTVPPEQDTKRTGSGADSEYGKALNLSRLMGRIAAFCIIGAILLLVFRLATRKRKASETEG